MVYAKELKLESRGRTGGSSLVDLVHRIRKEREDRNGDELEIDLW